MVAVNQETVNSLREHLNMVQVKFEEGVVAKADVLRAEVELANAQQNVIKSQNSFNVAMVALLNTMNLDGDTQLMLKDQISYAVYGKTLKEAIELAKSNHPDIIQANLNVRIAEIGVKLAKSGNEPSVSLSASTELKDSFLPKDDNWSMGLSANWSVFDGGAIYAKVKQTKVSVDKMKRRLVKELKNKQEEQYESTLAKNSKIQEMVHYRTGNHSRR